MTPPSSMPFFLIGGMVLRRLFIGGEVSCRCLIGGWTSRRGFLVRDGVGQVKVDSGSLVFTGRRS
jgi:hypothetical protein